MHGTYTVVGTTNNTHTHTHTHHTRSHTLTHVHAHTHSTHTHTHSHTHTHTHTHTALLPHHHHIHSLQAPLRPYSYPANLDIWNFHLDNFLSQFPPYDTEFISEGELTLLDMHHNFFEKEKTLTQIGVPIDTPGSVKSEITALLRRYTG